MIFKIRTLWNRLGILACTLFVMIFTSCLKEGAEVDTYYYGDADEKVLDAYLTLPKAPYDYNFSLPTHTALFAPPVDNDMATLGRVLFYDKNLSSDKKISCASCHKQELAFSDNTDFSTGVAEKRTSRNSIALGSVLNFSAYYGEFGGIPFFWDNRAFRVQDQSRATLGNPSEMNMEMHQVKDVVNKLPYYKPLAKAALSKETLSEDDILNAIGAFVNSLTNYHTKFDRELDKTGIQFIRTNFNDFTTSENRGKLIYLNRCATCHGENAGRPPKIMANNGLDMEYKDNGVGGTSNKAFENAKFKVPTLRNILRTAPYMHDGRFATMDDVLNHYSSGIKNHPNLDTELKLGGLPMKMNFTSQDKADLIAFLNTLSDDQITSDKKFSDPFKK